MHRKQVVFRILKEKDNKTFTKAPFKLKGAFSIVENYR